jgi:hypothetical protein
MINPFENHRTHGNAPGSVFAPRFGVYGQAHDLIRFEVPEVVNIGIV